MEKEEDILKYLKGYLSAISALNSFTNEHLIADVNSFEIDPKSKLEEILIKICRTDKYTFEVNKIGNLETELKKILPKYTERFIAKIAETRAYPFGDLDEERRNEIISEVKAPIDEIDFSYTICSMINKLIVEHDEIYKVKVNDSKGPFYSLQDDSFLIKGVKRAIYLKLGITD